MSETVQTRSSSSIIHQDESITTTVENSLHDTILFAIADNDRSTDTAGSVNSSLPPHELNLFDHSSIESTRDYESFLEPSNGLIRDDLFDTTFDILTPLIHDQVHGQAHSNRSNIVSQVASRSRSHDASNSPLVEIPTAVCVFDNQHTNGTNMPHATAACVCPEGNRGGRGAPRCPNLTLPLPKKGHSTIRPVANES
jgi:hypothetical protein